jgi:DNA invertase Pin-like site-specific DNA recombinase
VRAVGYLRVSTTAQAESRAGLGAQRAAIEAESARRGWQLVEVLEDAGLSGRSLSGRLGLLEALRRLAEGDADVLVVAKLDRLSRSLVDFAGLLERARREKWAIVALDLGVDTTSGAGELVASVMASVAVWERRTIGARTKEALAVKRAQGVRLGRPPVIGEDVRKHVRRRRKDGLTLRAIAAELDQTGVPTAHGAPRWQPESVRKLLLQGDLRKR